MRTYCAAPMRPEKPHIVIVDSKKLRQAGIVRLLDAWAGDLGLTVSAVELASLIERHRAADCAMVILSVGSASVEDPQQQAFIKCTRKLMPRAPLVILSDREEPKEVCAACPSSKVGDLFFPRPLCIGKCHQSQRKLPSKGLIGPISVR